MRHRGRLPVQFVDGSRDILVLWHCCVAGTHHSHVMDTSSVTPFWTLKTTTFGAYPLNARLLNLVGSPASWMHHAPDHTTRVPTATSRCWRCSSDGYGLRLTFRCGNAPCHAFPARLQTTHRRARPAPRFCCVTFPAHTYPTWPATFRHAPTTCRGLYRLP